MVAMMIALPNVALVWSTAHRIVPRSFAEMAENPPKALYKLIGSQMGSTRY
ncbi:hypothetical protein JCM18750_39640 [Halostagnicola bangensis]